MENTKVSVAEKIDTNVIYEMFLNNPNDYALGEKVRMYIYELQKETR
jgi:hypothetical protein